MSRPGFTVDHWLRLQQPAFRVPMHLSPDGCLLAISVQGKRREFGLHAQAEPVPVGVPVEAVGSRVLVVDTATGAAEEPFPQAGTSWGAQWSPDGTMLAAYVQQEGPACIGIWHRASGAVSLLRQAAVWPFFGFEVPRWTPDGRSVIAKLAPPRVTAAQRGGQTTAAAGTVRVRVFSFDPDAGGAPAAAGGPLPGSGCDLGSVDVVTGEVRKLAEDWSLRGWEVAPDGHAVAVLRHTAADQTRQERFYDLTVVPLDGGAPRVIAARIPQSYGIRFSWSPDSRRIAYATEASGEPIRLFVVPADGSREPAALSAEGDMQLRGEYEAPRWSPDGERIYCLAGGGYWEFAADGSGRRLVCTGAHPNREAISWIQRLSSATCWLPPGGAPLSVVRDRATKTVALMQADPGDGRTVALAELEMRLAGGTFGVEAAADGAAVYLLLESAAHPPEVWQFTGAFREPRRLLSLNPALAEVALGTSRLVEWTALDGQKLRGALLLPPGYEEGQRVPVIVDVYGGSFGSDLLHVFGGAERALNGQLLAARGYAVLYPDLPLEDRDPLRQLPAKLLPALDRLVELGIADPNRIGLMGQSYGGYCVLALLTQTRRLRAAVAVSLTVNLTSFYGIIDPGGRSTWVGWAETGQGRTGGSLWERRDAYVENSPLFYLDRVTTPLLLVSGTLYQGEAAQAGEAFSALRRLGKRVELRLYEGEDHWPGFWTEAGFRDYCDRVLAWFDAYLKP